MIDYFFERRRKVLMARISADFDAEQASQLDRIAETLAAREPGLRAIYDFTDLTDLRIPAAQIAERADEIDVERAEEEKRRAETQLSHRPPAADLEAARVSMLGSEQIAARQWDCVVTSGAPLPASVTSHQSVDCFTAAPPN